MTDVKFCWCGLVLIRSINKRYDGTREKHCNEECEKREARSHRLKNRPKYGVTGYIYDQTKRR